MQAANEEILNHPEHGEIPARRLLDCIFALTPQGRILHFHVEQCSIAEAGGALRYALTGAEPLPERARCQVIPPFVTAFRRPGAR